MVNTSRVLLKALTNYGVRAGQRVAYRSKHAGKNWHAGYEHKVIFAFGAGAGLCASMALRVHEEVPSAIIIPIGLAEDNDPKEPGLTGVAETCGTEAIVCDVTDDDAVWGAVNRAFDQAEALTGRREVDYVWYAPGVAWKNSALFDDPAASQKMIDVNVHGYYRVLHAVAPFLVDAKGHVVIFSSLAAKVPLPGMGCYAGTKGDVFNMTESLEQEMWGSGVTFTTLIMSFIDSGMTREGFDDLGIATKLVSKLMIKHEKAIDILVPSVARKQRYIWIPGYMRLLTDWLPPAIFRQYKLATRLFGGFLV